MKATQRAAASRLLADVEQDTELHQKAGTYGNLHQDFYKHSTEKDAND